MLRLLVLSVLLSAGGIAAEATDRQSTDRILVEIEMTKAKITDKDTAPENKVKIRLNKKLDALKKLVTHISANRSKPSTTDFTTLWRKMNSVEGRSAVYPELIMRILEMPIDDLITKAIGVGLIGEVPGATRGCCAIDSYYKFVHEKAKDMPDDIMLAFRARLHLVQGKPANGLYHGIMIELVDRGYYDSYNGYRCADNKVKGCRIVAD